jgi:hypothetical protein
MSSMPITALWLQLGRIYFVPISRSKALLLVAAPLSVHNEEKHSSIATYLLRAVKTIGVRRRSDGCVDERKDPNRWKSDFYSWRYQLLRFPIGTSVWWRLVETRIQELYADYGSLVAARTNILCAD